MCFLVVATTCNTEHEACKKHHYKGRPALTREPRPFSLPKNSLRCRSFALAAVLLRLQYDTLKLLENNKLFVGAVNFSVALFF